MANDHTTNSRTEHINDIQVVERMVRAEETVKTVAGKLQSYIHQESKKNNEMRSEISLLIGKVDQISTNLSREHKIIKNEIEEFVDKYYLSEKDYFERTLGQNNLIDLKIIKSKYEVIKIMSTVGGAIVATLAICQWLYIDLSGYSLVVEPVKKVIAG